MNYERHRRIIDVLLNCAAECDSCASACLDEKEVNRLATCIRLNIDCAAICRLTASFLARGSEFAFDVMEICAEICENCAIECEKHAHMKHCRHCADVCRRCEEECRQVA